MEKKSEGLALEFEKLKNDKNLRALEHKLSREVNIFDILKISDAEIRHSNILAWLLDANQNHGLDDLFVRELFSEITNKNLDKGFDFHELKIYRERWHLDLILEYNAWGKKIVVCIENKVHAGEGRNQLARYKEVIDKNYPKSAGWETYFAFLTLDGHESSDPETWQSLSYEFILNTLKTLLKEREFELNIRSETIIKQYLSILERQVIGMDEQTKNLIKELNGKYPNAMRAISEFLSDTNLTVTSSESIRDWFKNNPGLPIRLVEEKSTKSLLRFESDYMNSLFPKAKEGGNWGDGYKYFYEIGCFKNGRIDLNLVFALGVLNDDEQKKLEILLEHNDQRKKREIKDSNKTARVKAFLKYTTTQYLRGFNEDSDEGNEDPTEVIGEEKLRNAVLSVADYENEVRSWIN